MKKDDLVKWVSNITLEKWHSELEPEFQNVFAAFKITYAGRWLGFDTGPYRISLLNDQSVYVKINGTDYIFFKDEYLELCTALDVARSKLEA